MMQSFLQQLRKFRRDERGSLAVIFAVMAVVIFAVGGASIDFITVQQIRTTAQASLDATALALQSEIYNKSEEELAALAEPLLIERIGNANITATIEEVIIDDENGTLWFRAEIIVPTSFVRIVGVNELSASVISEVTRKSLNLEVALVLDTTYSMLGAKLTSLKNSANLLVDELMGDEEDEDIRIAVIPFSRYVNIGMANRNEPGTDIPDDYDYTPPGQNCYNTYPDSTYSCDWEQETYSCVIDGVPSTCTRWVSSNCTGSYGDPVQVCEPYNTRTYTWRGCMGSRPYPLDILDDSYSTEVPAIMDSWNSCRAKPLTRLSPNKNIVQAGINAMVAKDYTYVPTGLLWGWRLLSQAAPFSDAKPYSEENNKVMVVMTDGANTVSPRSTWRPHKSDYIDHYGSNVATANARTLELCANILDDDIKVYTVAFEVSDPDIIAILQACAGNGGSFFDAANGAELLQAFADIANDLQELRLSK